MRLRRRVRATGALTRARCVPRRLWRPFRRSSEAGDEDAAESFSRDPVKHGSEEVSAEKMDEEDIKAHYVKDLFHDIPAPYKHPETFQRVIITAEDHEFDQEAAEVRGCGPRCVATRRDARRP